MSIKNIDASIYTHAKSFLSSLASTGERSIISIFIDSELRPIVNMAPLPRLDHTLETVEEDWKTEDDTETDLLSETRYGNFRRDRGVRFAMTARRRNIMCLEEYTEDEVRNSWYSLEDKEKMKKKHNKVVARFESGKEAKRGMNYRGLECWTKKGGHDLDFNISKCADAVLDEQDAQWNASIDDCERVAAASQEVTVGSAKRALAIGREDEREAIEARASLEDTVSKPKSKSKTRSSRSLCTEDRKDPPGMIRRESSQIGSDILTKMRMASRKARTRKV
jgi:hypothetical protein